MAVRIRLSRGGSKKRPFYRVVVADARSPRDGRFIERLGSYNPTLPQGHAERFTIDVEKTKEWLTKGALPTDRLEKMLANLGLCKAPVYKQTKQHLPKAKAQARIKEKEAKAEAAAAAEKAAKEAEIEAKRAAKEAAKAAAEAPAPVATEVAAEEAPASAE